MLHMAVSTLLLIVFGVGILVAMSTKKLTPTEVVVVGIFFLLLGATPVGHGVTNVLNGLGR